MRLLFPLMLPKAFHCSVKVDAPLLYNLTNLPNPDPVGYDVAATLRLEGRYLHRW